MNKRKAVKIICAAGIFLILIAAASPDIYASDTEAEDFGLSELYKSIPKEIADELPMDIFTADASPDGELEKKIGREGIKYVFEKLVSALKAALLPAAGTLSSLLGSLLLSSALNIFSRDISSGRLSSAFSLVSCLVICLTAFASQSRMESEVTVFIGSLTAFSGALVPVLSAVMLASANTLGATVTASGLIIFTAAAQYVCSYIFVPLYRVCLGLCIVSSVGTGGGGSARLCELIKRCFTVLAAGAAVIFTAVLTYQSQLAAAADGIAARSIKYTVGSAIPIVGSALGDAVRFAASGLSVIKSSAGLAGLFVLIALAAPVICHLLCNGFILGIAAAAAKILGCDREAVLFSELKSISGFALAAAALSCVVFIITVAIILKMNPAAAV